MPARPKRGRGKPVGKSRVRPARKSHARPARKAARKPAKRPRAPEHRFTPGLDGWITHTDLASLDPAATKAWCAKVLGWRFATSIPVPGGEVHLFTYSAQGGGGVRPLSPPETPGSIPYVHVPDCAAAYAKALAEGAVEMMPPTRVMAGVTVAIVRAPGGVPIGFSGP